MASPPPSLPASMTVTTSDQPLPVPMLKHRCEIQGTATSKCVPQVSLFSLGPFSLKFLSLCLDTQISAYPVIYSLTGSFTPSPPATILCFPPFLANTQSE